MASERRSGWRVVSATFEVTAAGPGQYPAATVPEIAIAGRSNVGKSSLLNAFARRRGLARVSRTPGRTRLLGFYMIELRSPTGEPFGLRCVDLPGYGFAATSRRVERSFGPLVEGYLGGREAVRGLVLLVDGRRGLCERDLELLEYAGTLSLPTLLTATKVDKLTATERGLLARRIADTVGVSPRDILLTSASRGMGIEDEPGRGGLVRDLVDLAHGGPRAGG